MIQCVLLYNCLYVWRDKMSQCLKMATPIHMLTCPKLPKLWSNRVFVLNLRLMMADTKHMNIAFFHMHFPYHG